MRESKTTDSALEPCPACNHEIAKRSHFCINCGNPFESNIPNQKGIGLSDIIIGVAIGNGLLITLCYFFLREYFRYGLR